MNSTFKKPRLDTDCSDISSLLLKVSNSIGKFKQFSISPDTYLNLFKESVNLPDQLDKTVDLFFKLLNKEMHLWFFEEIYLKNISFEDFSKLFIEYIQECSYEKINSLSYNLDRFIEFENANPDNRLRFYFERKRVILKETFDLNSELANVFAASFLNYDTHKRLSKVLSDEDALDSLLELENNREKEQINLINNFGDETEHESDGLKDLDKAEKEDLLKKLELVQKERQNLQTQNDNLESQIQSVTAENQELKEKLKAFSNESETLKAIKVQKLQIDKRRIFDEFAIFSSIIMSSNDVDMCSFRFSIRIKASCSRINLYASLSFESKLFIFLLIERF